MAEPSAAAPTVVASGTSEEAPMVEVREARRRFGDRFVLDGIDLTLRPGEIYALVGPNGAGKTSLVRAICGRLVLDSGSVRIAGTDPRDPDARRRLGLVPQSIALYGELTVRHNLEILGRLAGVSGSDLVAAVEHALEWTGLASRSRDRVVTLSGGMQRRLNIAAGTLHRPAVLLLDEPTVGIDPAARESVQEMLRALRDRGMALLLTTHDLEQAETLGDRIGILMRGRLEAEGALAELVRTVFGDSKELTVGLVHEPDETGTAALRAEGLVPVGDARTWTGRLETGLEQLGALERRLRDARVEVHDLRVREPDLRGVFFRMTGQELPS